MAVAFDASSESHTGTTPSTSVASFNWTHAGAGGGIRGVLVWAFNLNANTEDVTEVDYGGVKLTRVQGAKAADTTTEPGTCRLWFASGSLPAGSQTVTVTRNNNANEVYAVCITVTAATDTCVHLPGIVLLENNGTLAVQSVTDGSPGTNSVRFAAGYTGRNATPAVGAGSTALQNILVASARGAVTCRETTAGQGARNVGFSDATSDDRAFVHLAIREMIASDYGNAMLDGGPNDKDLLRAPIPLPVGQG